MSKSLFGQKFKWINPDFPGFFQSGIRIFNVMFFRSKCQVRFLIQKWFFTWPFDNLVYKVGVGTGPEPCPGKFPVPDRLPDFFVTGTVLNNSVSEFRIPQIWVLVPPGSRSWSKILIWVPVPVPAQISGIRTAGSRGPCPGCQPLLQRSNISD